MIERRHIEIAAQESSIAPRAHRERE